MSSFLRKAFFIYCDIAKTLFIPTIIILIIFFRKDSVSIESAEVMRLRLDSISKMAVMFENKNKQIVTENIAIRANSQDQIKNLSDQLFNLKKQDEKRIKSISGVVKATQSIRVDTLLMPYSDTVYANNDDCMPVPRHFLFLDSLRLISGTVTREGIMLDSLDFKNDFYVRFGVQRTGFLNLARRDFVQAVNTSPYVTTTGLGMYYYRAPVSRWNRWIKPTIFGIIGVAAGAYIIR